MARNNRTELCGFLANDPHFEMLPGQVAHIRFDLIVPRDASQASRKQFAELPKKERRDYLRVVAYGAHAHAVYFYLRKGTRVVVFGWNESRRYRDPKTRSWRRVHEVNAEMIVPSAGADFKRGDQFLTNKLAEEQAQSMPYLEALGLTPLEDLPEEVELGELE